MIIYPAIDIRGGRCVRLVEGDFDRETTFDADPVDAAGRWIEAGATWLHVVDLDGARAGQPVNLETIRRLRSNSDVPIQYGGGVRDNAHLATVFEIGVDRVVLGTAAIRETGFVEDATTRWGNRIAAGLDARDGLLAAHGWLDQTSISAQTRVIELQNAGVRHIVFTDIRRDGTLQGPNLAALKEMNAVLARDQPSPAALIASGGVGSLADVIAVRAVGVAGVIIGRALYDGRVALSEALGAVQDTIEIAP